MYMYMYIYIFFFFKSIRETTEISQTNVCIYIYMRIERGRDSSIYMYI